MLGCLIFDLDGTLVDCMPQHAEAFARVLQERHGLPPARSRAIYLDTAGQHLDQQFSRALEMAPRGDDAEIGALVTAFYECLQDFSFELFPDVQPALDRLRAAGYTLAVSSSGTPDVVESKLDGTGIRDDFAVALGTDKRVENMWKGEGHFQLIRQACALESHAFPQNAAMVGDGEHDMRIARDAGIFAVGRETDGNASRLRLAGAQLTIHDLHELVGCMQSVEGRFLSIDAFARGRSRQA